MGWVREPLELLAGSKKETRTDSPQALDTSLCWRFALIVERLASGVCRVLCDTPDYPAKDFSGYPNIRPVHIVFDVVDD